MKKVLIIRFSSIGDIVLTTPVIRCLKKQADVELHYLTKKAFQQILANNPYVDKVHVIENDMIESDLKAESFDCIIDLHHNMRSMKVKRWLAVDSFVFPKMNVKKWLLVNLKWNLMGNRHVVDRYFEPAHAAFGIHSDGEGLDYFIPEKDELFMSDLPNAYRSGYVAFVIGGQHDGKMMSVDKIARVCSALEKPVLLLGGPDDISRGKVIARKAGDLVLNTAGDYNLNQSASLLRMADVVISHDTGLMHIASAFGKRIVSLWGGTVPELGFSPYRPGKGSEMIGASHFMRPSSKLGKRKGVYRLFDFMNMINEQEIIDSVTRK